MIESGERIENEVKREKGSGGTVSPW